MPNAHDPHDTDGSLHASHHTIGVGPFQAYSGKDGAALAAQMLLSKHSWNDVGRNALLNGSFEAWNETVVDVNNPGGIPYNWGFFWSIGLRGNITRCDQSTVPTSRDESCVKWTPLDPAGSVQYVYSEGIKVNAGEIHTIGCWAKTQNNGSPIKIGLQYYWDPVNTNPGPFAGTGVTAMLDTNMTTEWVEYKADIVVPATATYLCVYVTLTSASPVAEQYALVDQVYYDKSKGAGGGITILPWEDPGINYTLNNNFDEWPLSPIVSATPQGMPATYSFVPDATWPSQIMKDSTGTVARNKRNCARYAPNIFVGGTAHDRFWSDTQFRLLNGDYFIEVWVKNTGVNPANPLPGIDGVLTGATTSAFSVTTEVSVNLMPVAATGTNYVGNWIKLSGRVTAPSGPYWKMSLDFTNNPSIINGWYFQMPILRQAEFNLGTSGVVSAATGSNASAASTSFAALSPGLETSFVVPPSGSVIVTIFNDISMSGTAAGVGGYEIRTASGGGGSVIIAADDTRANLFAGAAGRVAASGPKIIHTGLTPGTTYWIRHMGRNGTGTGAATFNYRRLFIEPILY